MHTLRFIKSIGRLLGSAAVFAIAGYGSYVAFAWFRYGRPAHVATKEESDPLLDRFMPVYEVVERHSVRLAAPADVTLSAACEMNLQQSGIIRAIFKTRELVLGGGQTENGLLPRELLAQVKSLGWGVLAEVAGREVVMGAVTQPWASNVIFRAVPADTFAAFQEPGYVKIVWTLRADPTGDGQSVFRTETRAVTTDVEARHKFRLYWAFFSPGIKLIRRMSLRPLKTEAEARARQASHAVERLKAPEYEE